MDYQTLWKNFEKELSNFPGKFSRAAESLSAKATPEMATTPAKVAYSEDKMRLLHYQPLVDQGDGHPVSILIVYALINRHTLLDMDPDRSFVRNLLNHGLDVWLIDWGYPSGTDRYLNLDDYINYYMDTAVEHIRSEKKADRLNLMGICMGGTFTVIYTALHPEKVRNLITFAAPIETDGVDSVLFSWAKHLDPDKVLDAFGNLPGNLANLLYLLATPVGTVDRYVRFLDKAENPEFVRSFMGLEKWSFDSPDMAGEVFRDYIRDIFQKNLLMKNELKLNDEHADLRNIRCPLFNAFGTYDHLVPPASSKPLSRAVGSDDVRTVDYRTGHIGMFVGKNSKKSVIPDVAGWIKAR